MTEAKANEILRTKYPEATIFRRNSFGGTSSSEIAVVFKPNGRVYYYQASSYQVVLNKLGFNVLYKHDVINLKNEISDLEEEIKTGTPKYSLFGRNLTDEEISQRKNKIADLKAALEDAIIV